MCVPEPIAKRKSADQYCLILICAVIRAYLNPYEQLMLYKHII